MTLRQRLETADWNGIDLVVFDVDGTLYSQSRLRYRILRDLLIDAVSTRSLSTIFAIRTYRRIRERLGDLEAPDFQRRLIAETAAATGHASEEVRSILEEWIEQRPLPYLSDCRYPGLTELFAGLRRKKKTIGILSDYPASRKLSELGLAAEHIVCATDEAVGFLKPNPRGLQMLIGAAGVSPCQTVVIGDRVDRDGIVAKRVGAWPLIKSSKPINGWQTVARFDDPIFQNFLQ